MKLYFYLICPPNCWACSPSIRKQIKLNKLTFIFFLSSVARVFIKLFPCTFVVIRLTANPHKSETSLWNSQCSKFENVRQKKQISCRLIMWQMFRLEIELREDKWRDYFLSFIFSTNTDYDLQRAYAAEMCRQNFYRMFAVGPNQRIKSKFAIVHSNRINLERISYMSHLLPAGTIFLYPFIFISPMKCRPGNATPAAMASQASVTHCVIHFMVIFFPDIILL